MRKNLFNFNLDISPGKSGSLEGQITCEPCLSQCEKIKKKINNRKLSEIRNCLLYTSPSPRDMRRSRMPSSA